MSRNNTLAPITAILLVASGAVAGYTGYTYMNDSNADKFYLYELGEVRAAAMQTVFLAEKAATNADFIPDLEAMESTVERSISRLRNGDVNQSIPGLPGSAGSSLNNFDAVWSEIAPGVGAIIGSRSSTEAFTRSSQEASRSISETIALAQQSISNATQHQGVSDSLKSQLEDSLSSLKLGTGNPSAGRTLDIQQLRDSDAAIGQFISAMTTIGNALPRDNTILEPLLRTFRSAQGTQRAISRSIDASSNSAQNLPHANEIFGKRDRLHAAGNALAASINVLPEARPINATIVAISGLLTISLSLIAFFAMLKATASREKYAETKGMSIEANQSNKSKEHLLLLSELRRVESGDLATPLTDSKESTRETARALNSVFASIRSILDEARTTVVGLAAAAEQTLLTAKNVDRNRQEQFNAIEHISDLINKMLNFIDVIEKMTTHSNSVSGEVSNKVRSGTDSVNKVHEGITLLSQQNTGIQHRSKNLIESFQHLERIADVVKTVAQKSSYVSWNAYLIVDSITEPAVAAQVTKSAEAMSLLSKESALAVAEITTLLKTMNDAARDTQHVVDNSQVEIENLLKRSDVAQESLTSIRDMTEELRKSVESVSEGTQELKSKSGEIAATMESINHYATENSAASEQTAAAIHNVNSTAQQLQKLIEPYTISQ